MCTCRRCIIAWHTRREDDRFVQALSDPVGTDESMKNEADEQEFMRLCEHIPDSDCRRTTGLLQTETPRVRHEMKSGQATYVITPMVYKPAETITEEKKRLALQREREEQAAARANLKLEMALKPVVPATVMLSRRANHVVARTLIESRSAGGGLVPGYHEATCFVYKGMPRTQFDQKTKDWILALKDHDLLVSRLSSVPGLKPNLKA